MQFDLIIKNGTVITDSECKTTNIGIKAEKITALGNALNEDGANIIDATGKYIFPGGIDVHTHIDMPLTNTNSADGSSQTTDDFYTGTMAAACGGTTSIVDFAVQSHGESLASAIEQWQKKAANKAVIDYGFHVLVVDPNPKVLAEIPQLIAQGYPSYKVMMTYQSMRVDDAQMLDLLTCTKEHGGLVTVHAENFAAINYLVNKFKQEGKSAIKYHPLSRPPIVEAEATNRAIKLAQIIDAPLYVVHVTCADSLFEVARARQKGAKIMAETCPQYLLLSDEQYDLPGFESAKYVITPPLRPRENQDALWQGLAAGNLLTVATDHCPINFKGQKDAAGNFFADIPGGMAGVEARVALIFDRGVNAKKISLQKFVAITATNPAKIFGMYPQKGTIAVGSDADLVVFDPQLPQTIRKTMLHERVDYTPYENFTVKGYPITTISRGTIVYDQGKFVGKIGRGKFLARKPGIIL